MNQTLVDWSLGGPHSDWYELHGKSSPHSLGQSDLYVIFSQWILYKNSCLKYSNRFIVALMVALFIINKLHALKDTFRYLCFDYLAVGVVFQDRFDCIVSCRVIYWLLWWIVYLIFIFYDFFLAFQNSSARCKVQLYSMWTNGYWKFTFWQIWTWTFTFDTVYSREKNAKHLLAG
jgi:hypothetical protein